MKARRAAIGLVLLTASSVTPSPARAALELLWDAPPGCPKRDEVQERIRAIAGSILDQTQGVSVEGRITRVDGRFQLTLLLRDGGEVRKRVIASESCETLGGAATVSLALLLGIDVSSLDPPTRDEQGVTPAPSRQIAAPGGRGAVSRDQEGRAEVTGRGDEEPGKRADRSVEKIPASPAGGDPAGSASTRRWAVVAQAPIVVADLGPLPQPTLGAGLGVGMRYESWRVMFVGYLSTGQTVNVSDSSGAFGTELEIMTGQIAICRGWRWRRFEVAPCVGVALERMTARGVGDGVAPSTQQVLWPAPNAGAVVHWYATESLAFLAGVTGYLEFSRPHLVIEDRGEVTQIGPVAAGATTGLEWSF